jgi:hypothetical protein
MAIIKVEAGEALAVLILFDTTNSTATSAPPIIFIKWQTEIDDDSSSFGSWFQKPYLYFSDFDGLGKSSLVFERLAHNGTVINAADYEYYHIDGVELQRVFSRETRFQGIAGDEGKHFDRDITIISPGHIRVTASIHDSQKQSTLIAGTSELIWNAKSRSFKEKKSAIVNEKYRALVVAFDSSWKRGVMP